MADQMIRTPKGVTADRYLDMVRAATFDALMQVMTAGTANPGDAFYSAIKDGVREAVRATASAGQLRLVTPDSAPKPNAPAAEEETP